MPRPKKKFHFIYKTVNKLNGKYYIGMHSTDKIDDSYLGSGKHLRYSINKYGAENFDRTILEFCEDRKTLKLRERDLVNELLLLDPLCMNLTYGGQGGWEIYNNNSDLQRDKSKRGRDKLILLKTTDELWLENFKIRKSAAHKAAVANGSIIVPDWTGRTHSDDTKAKISVKSKIHQAGDGNSQHGTCWIYNIELKQCKKIKKIELDQYSDWILGRKMKF